MNYLTKINPWKTAFFIAIFEFFTFGILHYFKFDAIVNGLIVGFIGGMIAIVIFNLISSSGFKLDIWIDKKETYLKKLDYLTPALANGIFLALLFTVQRYLEFEFRSELLNDALLGFFATLIAVMICILIYNAIIKFSKLRIIGVTSKGKFKVGKIDISRTSFFVALIELFILPSMGFFLILFQYLPLYLKFPLVGLLGGFMGTLIASYLYNFFAKFWKGIGFELE